MAALASLKGDIVELNKRLQQTERERDLLEKKLAKAQVKDRSASFARVPQCNSGLSNRGLFLAVLLQKSGISSPKLLGWLYKVVRD